MLPDCLRGDDGDGPSGSEEKDVKRMRSTSTTPRSEVQILTTTTALWGFPQRPATGTWGVGKKAVRHYWSSVLHASEIDGIQAELDNMGVRLTQLSQEHNQHTEDMETSNARLSDAQEDLKEC